jgi:hypothetical protein
MNKEVVISLFLVAINLVDYKMKILKIRYVFIFLGLLASSAASGTAQLSIGIGLPYTSIGINVPVYPELVVISGYPVYYAPRLQTNYFFYDGMYWVFQDDEWYVSSWYNGPWWIVEPYAVPVYILRIPVRYYRQPPAYFRGWRSNAPPRWNNHWGHDWEQHRRGWDKWDRGSEPTPAPLPIYQRQYSGDRYPKQIEQQHELQQQRYRYQPRDPVVRQQYQQRKQERAVQGTPAQKGRARQEKQRAPEDREFRQQEVRPPTSRQQGDLAAPGPQGPQGRGGRGEDARRPSPLDSNQGRPEIQDRRQIAQPKVDQHEQKVPRSRERDVKQQDKSDRGYKDDKSEQKRGRASGQQEQERGGRNE